jgi:hypothetical protein
MYERCLIVFTVLTVSLGRLRVRWREEEQSRQATEASNLQSEFQILFSLVQFQSYARWTLGLLGAIRFAVIFGGFVQSSFSLLAFLPW